MITRFHRLRRWGIIAASAFALYNVVGFLVLPPIVRSQIAGRASTALDREVHVEYVRMNPLSFAIAVHGIRVVDRDAADLASLRELYINADPLTSLLKFEWHLAEFRLVEPRGRLVIDEQGSVNVADLIEKFSADSEATEASSGGLPRAGIDEVRIERAGIEFTDRSRTTPFHTVVGPMTFALDDFATRPDAASPYTFEGTTNSAESFRWSGNITAAPLGSQGHVEFSRFSIPKHMPFIESLFPGSIESGTVSFTGNYRVALAGSLVALLEDATLAVDDLSLSERGAADALVKLGHFQVDIARADAVQLTAEIPRVQLDRLEVYATRDATGAIDLLRLVPPAPAPSGTSPGTGSDSGPAPSVQIATLAVSDARISIVDQSNPRTARLLLDQIAVTASNLGTDLDREVALEMSARWNERGSLSAVGTVRALPTAAKLQVKGDRLDLAPFDPLLAPFAEVRIKSGDVWFSGTVEAALAAGGQPSLAWHGDAGLDTLSVCTEPALEELAGWSHLALTGTEFTLEPLSVSAREIKLAGPAASVEVMEDGSVNLLSVLRQAPPAAGSEMKTPVPAVPEATRSERLAAATAAKLDLDARIDSITISDGLFRVRDRSFKPGFAAELRSFGGSIRGLSSENLARAEVDLSGSIDGAAPLRISGQINPLADDLYSDITVALGNLDLPMFSPYSGRFIGQKIQKGKLRVDLGYKVSQRFVEGKNNVVFDQFYLGEKVASDEAIHLPIGLALKLLRNREGKIILDPDVSGSLDDPDFSYGRIIWRTIGNLVVKAATSPFSLLGSMLPGAGGKDLSHADFASGSSALAAAVQEKVGLLVKALYEHPELLIEINSPPAPSTDRAGLIERRFSDMLRAEKQRIATLASVAPQDQATPPAGSLSDVAPDEVNALVASLFAHTFPDEAEAANAAATAAGVTPVAPVAASPDQDQPGFLRRTWRRVFGGGDSEGKAAESGAVAARESPDEDNGDAAPALTLGAMRERLIATIEISDEDYAALAHARGVAIRDALLADGRIEAERVFLVDTAALPEGATGSPDGGRVFFTLQ